MRCVEEKEAFWQLWGCLSELCLLPGTAAYLSKSAGEKNVFTAGSVKAQLTEASLDAKRSVLIRSEPGERSG